MDSIFNGPNMQDSLAMADPLAILVLLGAVAAAASLSVTEGINTCLSEAGSDDSLEADDVVTRWLDSLVMPPLNR